MNETKNALLRALEAAGYAQVREIEIARGADSTGEESLFVWLLLDDELPDSALDWDVLRPLLNEARQTMRRLQPQFYPYVRARRQREWQELALT